jgi:hypothetical protein
MRIILVLTALLLAPAAQAAPTSIEKPAITTAAHTSSVGGGHGFSSATSVLISNAMDLLGSHYRPGGSNSDVGFDCSGFVRNIFQQSVGMVLPRSARDQAAVSHKVDRSELQPGDLVFFNTMRRAFSHVGIYIGNGKFIHAARTGKGVRVDSMSLPYWNSRFNGGGRVALGSVTTASVESGLIDNSLIGSTSSTYGLTPSATPTIKTAFTQRTRSSKRNAVGTSAKKQHHARSSRSQKRGKR